MGDSSPLVKVYHFLNGKYGGVYTVVKNLIKYSQNDRIQHNVILVINQDIHPDFTSVNFLDSEYQYLFYYQPSWNFYKTCKRLSKLIPNHQCVLVANDWLELGMVSMLGLSNPVVQIVHGNYEYYYDLTKIHKDAVNEFIAVSEVISSNIKALINDKSINVQHISYPVNLGRNEGLVIDQLKILFVAADLRDSNKNFKLLRDINLFLEDQGVSVVWNIVGGGYSNWEIDEWWGNRKNKLKYHGFLDGEALASVYQESNVFVLPSFKEGLPVSLIEAMSYGLVPVINTWDDLDKSLIIDGQNGFLVKENSALLYASIILELQKNMTQLSLIGKRASESVSNRFSPIVQTSIYEDIILKSSSVINKRIAKKVYGSRLDHPLIPNCLTSSYRKLKQKFNG